MRSLFASLALFGLVAGLLGCMAPTAAPIAPGASPGQPAGGQPSLLVPPSLPRPTGPSSTIEIPPPIN